MPLSNENPRNIRSHNRKKVLKKMRKTLQGLETFPFHSIELERFCNPCSIFNRTLRNENGQRFNKMLPKQPKFVCTEPRFETYTMLDKRTNSGHKPEATRQSVDILADTFVNIIDSPNDPKCKVEITGHGYKGKFNVGLDPVIDEVLYQSLQHLKETYENSRFGYKTKTFDKRRNHTLTNIADNVRNYLKSKVTGKNSVRNSTSSQFSPENLIGRTSIHREETDIYGENNSQIIYEDTDVKHPRLWHCLNRKYPSMTKISRYIEKYKSKPKYHKRNYSRRLKKKRNINSSGSESFEEKQFIRKIKDLRPPVLESSDDSFILRETSSTLDESVRLSNTCGSTTNDENKISSLKNRALRNQNCCPDLSYISKKDWKAAAELLRREREGSMFSTDKSEPVKYMSLNEYEGDKSNKKKVQNNPTGNSKIVKVKETMTTTANGVTTVTQTEVIEAINQSSQCLIPSTSGEGFVARQEFDIMSMEHNESRREESRGRLAKVPQNTQRHRKLHEEAPNKIGINHKVVSNKNKENPIKVGYPRCLCPSELRCYEYYDEKKYLNRTMSIGNLGPPSPQNGHGYNDIISHNPEFQIQKDTNKSPRNNGHCHCNPHIVNTYTLSKEMRMAPHLGITDFAQDKLRDSKRKVSVLHKVNSDPINICVTKPNLMNCSNIAGNNMDIRINAISEIGRDNSPIEKKQNLQDRILLEKSRNQESKIPEEVICTQSGTAKIRVSLGSCDTTQRQQVYLELMEVLKNKLESENQLLNNKAPTHAVTYCDLKCCTTLKGFRPMQGNTTLNRKKKIEKGTFGKMNKTATVMPLAAESRRQRMHLFSGTLRNCKIDTKPRNCTTFCHRPCFCNEKRNSITSPASAEKIIPRQTRSSDSLLLNMGETAQPKDFVGPKTSADVIPKKISITEASNPTDLEEKEEKPKVVTTASQTEDLIVKSLPKSRITKQSRSSSESSIIQESFSSSKSSITTKQPLSSPKSSITKQSLSTENKRGLSRLSRELSARKSGESRPKIKTGSLFSKSLSEKSSMQASRLRRSQPILSETIQGEPRKSSLPETKEVKKSRISGLDKSKKKESARLSSRRETILSKRGTLFVRRSTPSSLYGSAKSRQSSVINQRVWIQNLNVPVKYDDHADVKKEKINERSKASDLHNLKNVSNTYSQSSETDSSIVNSGWNQLPSRKSNNRDFLIPFHDSENNDLSQDASMIYCFPKQSKEEKFIAYVRKVSKKPGKVGSVSFVPFKKSSSIIEIITEPNSVQGPFSKLTAEPSIKYSGKSTDSDNSSVISKYANGSIVSSDMQGKSNCSLLSFEESPSPVEYVENFEHHPPVLSVTSSNPRNISTGNKSFTMSSKPTLYGKCITALNETKNRSHLWADNCDSISLQCFTETNEAIKMDPGSPPTRKKHPTNLLSGTTSLEVKPSISSKFKNLRRQNNSSSGSSDSQTTVISRPVVYNNRLAMRFQNFISKPNGGTLDLPRSNNSSNFSRRRKRSSIESAALSERKKSLKSRYKRCDTRTFMKSNQPGINEIQNRSVIETVSSDDADFYENPSPIPECKQFDIYSTDPSTSQQRIREQKNDSDVNVENITSKQCKNETANLRKDKRKLKKGKILHSTSHKYNINSTLCINDNDKNAEEIESDDANQTTIGFDFSNLSLKKDNSKVTKCYKLREMDETICSSAAWIVRSSDSDVGTTAANPKRIHKRSKSIEKNQNKYLSMTNDLGQSSSELLAKRTKSNKRKIFVHTKRLNKNNEFEPCERSKKLIPSLLQKKRNSANEGPNDSDSG